MDSRTAFPFFYLGQGPKGLQLCSCSLHQPLMLCKTQPGHCKWAKTKALLQSHFLCRHEVLVLSAHGRTCVQFGHGSRPSLEDSWRLLGTSKYPPCAKDTRPGILCANKTWHIEVCMLSSTVGYLNTHDIIIIIVKACYNL